MDPDDDGTCWCSILLLLEHAQAKLHAAGHGRSSTAAQRDAALAAEHLNAAILLSPKRSRNDLMMVHHELRTALRETVGLPLQAIDTSHMILGHLLDALRANLVEMRVV